jgi:hypothetical protein
MKNSVQTTLKFELVPVADPNWDQYWPTQEWVAADEKYAFRIMRLRTVRFVHFEIRHISNHGSVTIPRSGFGVPRSQVSHPPRRSRASGAGS